MTHVMLGAILGPLLLVLGLSFLFYAKAWMELFKDLSKSHFHRLPIALGEFILGMFVLLNYRSWEVSVWLIITLIGWGMILESVFYLLAPGDSVKKLYKWFAKKPLFQVGGLIALALGALLTLKVFELF